jgi:hypothetical protein
VPAQRRRVAQQVKQLVPIATGALYRVLADRRGVQNGDPGCRGRIGIPCLLIGLRVFLFGTLLPERADCR